MLLGMLTETWLREHLDAEVCIDGYSIFRTDRDRKKKRRGRNSGGVAVYIRNDVSTKTEIFFSFSSGVIECLCLRVPKLNLILITVYRQPNDSLNGNISTSDQFRECLAEISANLNTLPSPLPTIILAGDFNLPHTAWPSCSPASGASKDEKKMIGQLQEFIATNFLSQIVAQPTHRGGNILDLILTNNPDIFPCIKISPTAFSSHKLVTVQTLLGQLDGGNVEGLGESAGFDTLNFFSELINWEKINEQLVSIDWTTRFGNQNVSKILETFLETCLNIAANNVPTKKNNALQKGKRVPRERKTLMRRRTKLNKSLSNQSTYGIKAKIECELINIEQKLQESYAREEQFNENKAVESINRNSKYFYTYAKKHCKLPPRVGPLEDANGHTTPDPQLMAEILSAQYSSVFSVPMGQVVDTSTEPNPSTDDLLFSEKQIEDAIDELSQNSAAGPDRFPAIFLKKCKNNLAKRQAIAHNVAKITRHWPYPCNSEIIKHNPNI